MQIPGVKMEGICIHAGQNIMGKGQSGEKLWVKHREDFSNCRPSERGRWGMGRGS